MNIILFDDQFRSDLLPLVFTRPVADIRIGILTIREKWEKFLHTPTSTHTEPYLAAKFPVSIEKDNLLINGSVLPDEELVKQIISLDEGQSIVDDDTLIAMRTAAHADAYPVSFAGSQQQRPTAQVKRIRFTWDIFSGNGKAIQEDFKLLTSDRKSAPLSKTNGVLGDPDMVFLEPGASVEYAYLNTTAGPVYIGRDASVMEGAKIRGPFALCNDSTVKMDAKIYEETTVGPNCKVGGEIQNSVIFGYSNKAHDGYLGNAVIGEWCNLGADTNNSNLKNTYDTVKLWSYTEQHFVDTGLQFCGLIMGDHSKSGINTMFNTGTVVGVSCNLYGAGFQRNFIPSFSWGSPAGLKEYNLKKAFEVASAVMKRRGIEFDDIDRDILKQVLEFSHGDRR